MLWTSACVLGVLLLLVLGIRSNAADVSNYEKILADIGISPDGPGIADYLQQLHPTEAQRQERST